MEIVRLAYLIPLVITLACSKDDPPSGIGPVNGSGPGANEPAGMTEVFDNPMTGDPRGLTADSHGFQAYLKPGGAPGTQSDETTLETDLEVPASPPTFWRHTTPPNSPGEPHWRAQAGQNFPNNTGMWYARIRLRFSSNFTFSTVGAPSGFQDVKFISPRQKTVSHNHFFGFTDNGPTIGLWLVNQGTGQDKAWRNASVRGNTLTDPGPGLPKGEWIDLELLATPNTPGQNDGTFKVFVDGLLRWTVTDMRWVDAGQNPALDTLFIDWIYSTGVGPVPGQTFDIDHWYLSVKTS